MNGVKASTLYTFFFTSAMFTLRAQGPTSFTLSTGQLLSEPGPTFRIGDDQLPSPLTVITYGDQRFTDPANVRQTNPRIRRWLVNQIAA